MPYFGNLICFVKECEILIEKDSINSLKSYESMYFNIQITAKKFTFRGLKFTSIYNRLDDQEYRITFVYH